MKEHVTNIKTPAEIPLGSSKSNKPEKSFNTHEKLTQTKSSFITPFVDTSTDSDHDNNLVSDHDNKSVSDHDNKSITASQPETSNTFSNSTIQTETSNTFSDSTIQNDEPYDLTDNVWINFDLFYTHFKKEERERRIRDFNKLYVVLKPYLAPGEEIKVDETILENYINEHQEENRRLIKKILSKIKYIDYNKFKEELITQINIFNKNIGDRKFILVIGSLTVSGDNQFIGQWQLFKESQK